MFDSSGYFSSVPPPVQICPAVIVPVLSERGQFPDFVWTREGKPLGQGRAAILFQELDIPAAKYKEGFIVLKSSTGQRIVWECRVDVRK
jgi:hypothetical protein